ncbi:MAG: hypothetical protein J7518_22785 [Nocardioidaceae bacterium]|nr:hypothetical protein [Nocardioidaceae bacterium]
MVVLLIVMLLALAALLVLVTAGVQDRIRQQRHVHEDADGGVPTLDYEVPDGQDPAVLMVALRQEGYEATVEPSGRHPHVLVLCPSGVETERDHVRAVVQGASVSALDDGVPLEQKVRFADE